MNLKGCRAAGTYSPRACKEAHHANAFHMAVAIEPIADAIARSRGAGSEIASVRRIGLYLPITAPPRPRARSRD